MEILKKYLLPFVVTILLIQSCAEREEPAPINETPEFYLKGSFDNEPFEVYVGENGYFLETNFYTDQNGKDWYSGVIKNSNNELELNLDFGRLDNTSSSDEILNSGILEPYILVEEEFYQVQFGSTPSKPVLNYEWNFGDGSSSTEANPIHNYPLKDQAYEVCLTITFDDLSTSILCQNVKPHLTGSLGISIQNFNNSLYVLRPNAKNFDIREVKWKIDGLIISNAKEIAIQNDNGKGIKEICLLATSFDNRLYEKCIQINTDSSSIEGIVNFNYASISIVDSNYNSIDTRTFSSDLVFGNSNYQMVEDESNELTIINSEPYINNPEGQQTRKISFKMVQRFSNLENEIKTLIIDEGVIAVAIGN